MTFVVAKDCFQLGLRVGAVVFWDVRISPASPELRADILREAQTIKDGFASQAAVRSCPEVAAFQELHRRVGATSRKEKSSVERLLALAFRRRELPTVNNLIDVSNLVSLRTRCSLAGYDFDAIACPVGLRLLTGRESFTPLGDSGPTAVVPGEYGYVDAADRLLCRLNVRQADFSKVTEHTRNVLLIVEGTTAHTSDLLCLAFDEAIKEVKRWCGGLAQILAVPVEDGSA